MKKFYYLLIIFAFFPLSLSQIAQACPACWAGYGSGDERFNKPLAELRLLYEREGRGALPAIREALKNQNDPLVKQRAADYIGELKDIESLPLLEQEILEITKKVSFSNFGLGIPEFQTRLKIAHILANLGAKELADRLWAKYDQLDIQRKMEVPYLLNALNDAKLTERLAKILERSEDHQLMLGAIDVLGMGGDSKALPFLRAKLIEWERIKREDIGAISSDKPIIYYSVLKIKAAEAISQIEDRQKKSSARR